MNTMVDYKTRHIAPTSVLNGKASVAYINDVSIMVTNVPKWTDELAKKLLDETGRVGQNHTPPAAIAIFLDDVFGSSHRKMGTDWIAAHGLTPPTRITMISDSKLVRGAMVAYSWLTKTDAKAFPMNQADAMCEWITQGLIAKPQDVRAALQVCFKLVGKSL